MFIQTQETPNPATLKFLPGQAVLNTGTAHFASAGDAVNSPLATRLFAIQGVISVFLSTDFVSVSKADDTEWSVLKPMVLAALMEHFSMGYPVMTETSSANDVAVPEDAEDEIVLQIKELIETRVRPAVMQDGGDIVFERFEYGIVYLEMQGACAGCPSSTMTLKSGIENMLKHFIPEVQEVRQSNL
jgi:Fe-S cluster biogenesis protein NfuA